MTDSTGSAPDDSHSKNLVLLQKEGSQPQPEPEHWARQLVRDYTKGLPYEYREARVEFPEDHPDCPVCGIPRGLPLSIYVLTSWTNVERHPTLPDVGDNIENCERCEFICFWLVRRKGLREACENESGKITVRMRGKEAGWKELSFALPPGNDFVSSDGTENLLARSRNGKFGFEFSRQDEEFTVELWSANRVIPVTASSEDRRTGTSLPPRLLYVGASSTTVLLKEFGPDEPLLDYVTLSYRWGSPSNASHVVQTTKETLSAHLSTGIEIDSLPKTIRDAVDITRRLGISYLWIDRLCIVQDDEEDWVRESSRMCDIYASSTLTISADDAEDDDAGIYGEQRNHRMWRYKCFSSGNEDYGNPLLLTEKWPHPTLSDFTQGEINTLMLTVDTSPLTTRAWTLQERLMSTRVLHFTRFEIVWECNTGTQCECARDSGFHSQMLESIEFDQLLNDDKIDRQQWLHHLWHQAKETSSKTDVYLAPSWSWASRMGSISYFSVKAAHPHSGRPYPYQGVETTSHIEVLDAGTSLATADPLGRVKDGRIQVSGAAVDFYFDGPQPEDVDIIQRYVKVARCAMEFNLMGVTGYDGDYNNYTIYETASQCFSQEEDSPALEQSKKRTIVVRDENHRCIAFQPDDVQDVRNHPGEYSSLVCLRVSEQAWGTPFRFDVGSKLKITYFLFLRPSSRVPGAYERVGLIRTTSIFEKEEYAQLEEIFKTAEPLPYNSVKEANSPTSAAVPDHENYPEVYNISEVYPEVVRDGTLPEAVVSNPAHSSKEALEVPEFTEETRLRRNRLRISILIALLVVVLIIAIVGGIVGSGVASRRQSTTEILDTTALASVSYKRADGVSQYRVYFQTTEGELCQSVWDSETGKWTVSPLRKANAANITGEPEVKLGTPLAAHIYGSISSDEYEYHLFFLDINNKIFELVSHDPDDMWKFSAQGALKGNYTAASFSSLASYGRQCGENCGNASSVVVWQNDDDKIMLAGYESSHGWASFSMNATIVPPPVHGTKSQWKH
ncbi:uncharacterized protein LTHEOB_1593 [Lasiodiplodia theobromae]|uniref:uncharacterized protein n=1 Tax=Lasiodiplodia theobromae TaxID=45133 RepID=UPI0015C3DD44|nr:uncharacterized protein LTHEOB_1593 [Lasiodiplodia theobromae]KAF4537402.1 hypothetical protein LTHEOB_1593 [Lasiodiplodia theobromae]